MLSLYRPYKFDALAGKRAAKRARAPKAMPSGLRGSVVRGCLIRLHQLVVQLHAVAGREILVFIAQLV